MMNKALPYIISLAAILGLIFLGVAFLALNSARLNSIFSSNAEHLDVQKSSSSLTYDDPLITYVPNDERSTQQKTKVFVSSQDPVTGAAQSNVYLIFYGSLLDPTMQTYLAADYGDAVTVVWKDFAITEADRQAAMVGHCADSVGKFWDYARAIGTQTDYSAVAVQVGVNPTELADCLATGGVGAIVDQSTALAEPLGVTDTASVFVNDQLFTDGPSVEQLMQTINEVLASF